MSYQMQFRGRNADSTSPKRQRKRDTDIIGSSFGAQPAGGPGSAIAPSTMTKGGRNQPAGRYGMDQDYFDD